MYDRGVLEVSKRKLIFELLQEEEDRCSEDFSVDPNGREGREMTAQEADELGDPELEGYWLEEEGPLVDIGQKSLELWWD